MKDISNFLSVDSKARRLKDAMNEAKKGPALQDVDMDKIEGKDADKNGTGGKIGYNEPVNDKVEQFIAKKVDRSTFSKNKKAISRRMMARDDFMVLGKAGWGKTSIIEDLAEQYGYEVITVYLDKCEASDLGGIPVPIRNKETGDPEQEKLPPTFAKKIAKNPKTQFLLFFDEMNQAAPDVMNALMPIVLKHEIAEKEYDNFFCGAAGNFESENGAVNELSEPLEDRLAPIIIWETDTDSAWKDSFDHIHKKYDDKVSKAFIDVLEKNAKIFKNPRDVENKLIKRYVYQYILNDDNIDLDEWQEHIFTLSRKSADDMTRTEEAQIKEVAQACYDCVQNKGKEPEKKEGRKRGAAKADISMIPTEIIDSVKQGMRYGYMTQVENGKVVKYGISRQNIYVLQDTEVNREQMERLVNKLEADGYKFKYETDDEWRKAGHKDPNED